MRREIREKKRGMLRELDGSPDFRAGRRLTFWLLAAAVALLAIQNLTQLAYGVFYDALRPVTVASLLLPIGTMLLLSWLIYAWGIRAISYIGIFAGLYSLFQDFTSGGYLLLFSGNTYYVVMESLFFAAVLTQTAGMAVIALWKQCGVYCDGIARVNRELVEWTKQNSA